MQVSEEQFLSLVQNLSARDESFARKVIEAAVFSLPFESAEHVVGDIYFSHYSNVRVYEARSVSNPNLVRRFSWFSELKKFLNDNKLGQQNVGYKRMNKAIKEKKPLEGFYLKLCCFIPPSDE